MKHKKDLPRKYWKYVRWHIIDKQGMIACGGETWGYKQSCFVHMECYVSNYKKRGFAVRPVLCLPLSMIGMGGPWWDKTKENFDETWLEVGMPKTDRERAALDA